MGIGVTRESSRGRVDFGGEDCRAAPRQSTLGQVRPECQLPISIRLQSMEISSGAPSHPDVRGGEEGVEDCALVARHVEEVQVS